MKCYTISPGGKLRKSMSPTPLKSLLADSGIVKKDSIAQAHLDFEPLPLFTLKELMDHENMYSYGHVLLRSSQTQFEKSMRFGKTAMMVMYEHGKFFPDKSMGDESEDVWMGRTQCLLVTREGKLALREIETGICYGIKGGNITKQV
jgi:hypothetical protein